MILSKRGCSLVFALVTALLFSRHAFAASLSIDTDYRLRGLYYTNNDFNVKTSTDAAAYYSQRLQLSLTGKFAPGIEIGSRLTALGVVGSTSPYFAVPYPRTDFTPFVEEAYVRLTQVADLPIDVTIGKQSITYGEGFLISDNGIGFNAFRIAGTYNWPLPLRGEVLIAKLKENFDLSSDRDLYGALVSATWQKHLWEIGYFEDDDFTGTTYRQGVLEAPTRSSFMTCGSVEKKKTLPIRSR